jgi:hypothetical protein
MTFTKTPVKILDSVTVATSNFQTSNGVDLGAAFDFCIGYRLTFNASATLGAEIRLFGDPEGGTLDFTIGSYANYFDVAEIPISAGHTVEGIALLQRSPRYVKARVYNLDAGQTITACSLWSILQAP